MNTLLVKLLLRLTSLAAAWLVSRLVEHHVIAPEDTDGYVQMFVSYATEAAPFVAIFAWEARAVVKSHLRYLAARLTPETATEAEVHARAQSPEIKALAFDDPATL